MYSIMAAVKSFVFARRLPAIKANVQEMKHIEKDIYRSCELLIKVLFDCRDASRFCIYRDEAEGLRSLGEQALQYAANCLQTSFSKAPPLLRKSVRYGGRMRGHRWKTPRNTLRRFDLRDSRSLRQSVLEIVLDGLWAHEALTDGMLDGTDDSSDEDTSEEDTAGEDADSEVIDEDLDDEDPDDEELYDEDTDDDPLEDGEGDDHELEDEEPDDEQVDEETLDDEERENEDVGDEDTDEKDDDEEDLHDGYTDDDNPDDKDLDIDDLPDDTDSFFNLANKAFLLCFGDQVSIDPGELTNRAGFETDYLKTGINVASHQGIHNRTWQCKMFDMSLHVLLALAHSHSSWFDNQPVYIWNQSITAKPQKIIDRVENTGCKELNFDPRKNPPVILLTPLEKAFWQRQHNALVASNNSTQSYTIQIRSLLDIIRISIQAHNPSFEYPFHTTRMFNTASQALHRIKNSAESYFGTTGYHPLRNQAFNPESECRPFPVRNQRQWAILNALDALYRCEASDEKRLIWAELVFGYAAGAALTILPAANGPDESVDLTRLQTSSSWSSLEREEMLAYTHFALVGVGQFLVEKFGGRRLCLWAGEEIPKTREQEMVMWIGFVDHPDGSQARLIPGVVCCR